MIEKSAMSSTDKGYTVSTVKHFIKSDAELAQLVEQGTCNA